MLLIKKIIDIDTVNVFQELKYVNQYNATNHGYKVLRIDKKLLLQTHI